MLQWHPRLIALLVVLSVLAAALAQVEFFGYSW